MSRVIIAGTGSGSGKTTITCGILGALKNRNTNIISFKVGPDYIDPMFHKKVTSITSKNLDLYLMGEDNVIKNLAISKDNDELAIIEGVMGLYDGVSEKGLYSANELSLLTKTPVILIVNAKGKSQSICAEIKGFLEYDKNNIAGIILNNTSEAMFEYYKNLIESKLNTKVLGFLPFIKDSDIPSRHLGLVTADEITDIKNKLKLVSDAVEKYIDLDELINIASNVEVLNVDKNKKNSEYKNKDINIYISEDEAFSFYYEENHELLRKYGATLKFFSPVNDKEIPCDAHGLIFWGGYPELYGEKLQNNKTMIRSIRDKSKNGIPIIGECGGYMYLHDTIANLDNEKFEMVGLIKGDVVMTNRLQNFGYTEIEAIENNILCKKGEKIKTHSFHRSVSSNKDLSFNAYKISNGKEYSCVYAKNNIFAGYPHIHFTHNENLVKNFIDECNNYKNRI